MKSAVHICFTLAIVLSLTVPNFAQINRAIDGSGNNAIHLTWGAAGTNQLNPGTVGFADGIGDPAGADRPNPRHISNTLFMQNTLANDPRSLSAYCWGWGQFIDHDITLVNENSTELMDITIPTGDIFFDPQATGTATMSMKRNQYDPLTGTDIEHPREYINHITAYIDASNVYGSDDQRAAWLRTFSGGKLKMSAGNMLPWNTVTGEFDAAVDANAPEMAMPYPFVEKWFVAGDVRANENPFLTGMHTLFAREHNRLCDVLIAVHPSWTDEEVYQYARKLVGGQMQAVVYEEWMPVMGMNMDAHPYTGYDPSINAGILNVFSAAAYRYGHTTINSLLVRMDNAGNYIPEGDILLRDAFFNPSALTTAGGIDPYLIGMATVVQQDFDCKLVDDLRNFLFGSPGAGGLDLAAINIARGRERGLPDYNTVRTDFGLAPVSGFSEMSADPLMNQTLEFVYVDINKIDPWVGMLAENHMPDALFGKTAMTIIKQQFLDIRDGDRYYYENDPGISAEDKQWIKETRLADMIRRNTSITIIEDEIFKVQSLVSATNDVYSIDNIDFALYPNPVQQMVFLRIPATSDRDAVIKVVDMQGRLILEREAQLARGNNTLTLTLPQGCAPGLYVLQVQSDNQTGQRLFFKED